MGAGCWGGSRWCEWASCEACRDGSTETDVSVSRQQVLCGQRLWKCSRSPASSSRAGCAGGGWAGVGDRQPKGRGGRAACWDPEDGVSDRRLDTRFLLELLASRLTWGGTRTGTLFTSAMCWDSSLSYDAAAIIYLRHSRPVRATPTLFLQNSIWKPEGQRGFPFPCFSPARPVARSAEEGAGCSAVPTCCPCPAPGLRWSPRVPYWFAGFRARWAKVPCLRYLCSFPSVTETPGFCPL